MDTWSLLDEGDIPAELDAEIRRGLCRVFPRGAGTFARTRAWNGCAPAFTALLTRDGRFLAHVGVVDRTVTTGGVPIRAAGVQNVGVDPDVRGEGFGAEAMRRAMAEAARRGFDCGLLFCRPNLEAFYAALGWKTVPGREVLRTAGEKDAPLSSHHAMMHLPLARTDLPEGVVHLRGNEW